MPSPRPLGSGVLKILILPQTLDDQVFDSITLPGYSLQPLFGLFFIGAGEGMSYPMIIRFWLSIVVFGIVVFFDLGRSDIVVPVDPLSISSLSSEFSLSRGPRVIPSLLWAIPTEVTLVSAMITSDCPYIKSISSSSSTWSWQPSCWCWSSQCWNNG